MNDVYSFGVGLQIGLAAGNDAQLFFAPSLAPMILKFGDRGQHQVQLGVSVPLLTIGSYSSYFGAPMTMLSYSYLF